MKKQSRRSAKEHQQRLLTLHAFTPMATGIARGFLKRVPLGVQQDDLIGAAIGGLWDAIVRDNGRRGSEFEWYARVRIRGAVLDELRTQDWLPRRARQAAIASGAPLASIFRLEDMNEVEQERALAIETTDIDSDVVMRERISAAIETLPKREEGLIRRYFFAGTKLKDIADSMGISEPRASQIKARALGRIREILREKDA